MHRRGGRIHLVVVFIWFAGFCRERLLCFIGKAAPTQSLDARTVSRQFKISCFGGMRPCKVVSQDLSEAKTWLLRRLQFLTPRT